jgi:hypothetical protein
VSQGESIVSDEIKPALTPEEWRDGGFDNGAGFAAGWNEANGYVWFDAHRFVRGSRVTHALAAVCLHQQPFGFTREDVKRLSDPPELYGGIQNGRDDRAWYDFCASLASRIAALLPPDTEER